MISHVLVTNRVLKGRAELDRIRGFSGEGLHRLQRTGGSGSCLRSIDLAKIRVTKVHNALFPLVRVLLSKYLTRSTQSSRGRKRDARKAEIREILRPEFVFVFGGLTGL